MRDWGDDVYDAIDEIETDRARVAEALEKDIAGVDVSPDGENEVVYQEDAAQYAARILALQRRLSMRQDGELNFKRAYIRYAHGGNVIELKTPQISAAPVHFGGSGKILDFSQKSRHRLLKFLNSIDRDALDVARLWMVTLTYPREWDNDPRAWKRHLKAFQERIRRAFGPLAAVWKLESQQRGAPHFHLIVIVPPSWSGGLECFRTEVRKERLVRHWRGGYLKEFREWCSLAWAQVVAGVDPRSSWVRNKGEDDHVKAGTNVEPLIGWNRVISYAAKYLGKECTWGLADENGEALSVGRFWGVWNREAWPVRWVSVAVPLECWVKIKRVLGKYADRVFGRVHPALKATVRSISVFMPASLIQQLYLWAFPAGATLHEAPPDVRRLMLECGIEPIPGMDARGRWLAGY
jgi:hypothetical protein